MENGRFHRSRELKNGYVYSIFCIFPIPTTDKIGVTPREFLGMLPD